MFQVQLSEEQLNYVIGVVAERPFKEVHQLIDSIRSQVQQQLAQAAQPAHAEPVTDEPWPPAAE